MSTKFDAFISYSHAADSRLAERLERGLQRFAKPWFKLRELTVFRDGANLNLSAHLWESIRVSLENSKYFIYLASEAAAQSPWVGREIAYWLEHRQRDTLILVVTDGNIAWDDHARDFDWSHTNCLPRSLSGAFQGEPFYLDMRWARAEDAELSLKSSRFTSDVALLSATLHGRAVEDMMGEELAQHRRATRWRNAAIGALSLLLSAAVLAAWQAHLQMLEADRQRVRAEQERDRAEASAVLTRVNAELQAGSLSTAAGLAMAGAARYPQQDSIQAAVRAVGLHPSPHLLTLRSVAREVHAIDVAEDGSRMLVVGTNRERIREARLFDARGQLLGAVDGVKQARLLDQGRQLLVQWPGQPIMQPMPDGSSCSNFKGRSQLMPTDGLTALERSVGTARKQAQTKQGVFMPVGFQDITADARRSVSICGPWLLVSGTGGEARAAAAGDALAARLSPTGDLVALQGPTGVRLLQVSALPIGAPDAQGPRPQPPGIELEGASPMFAPDGRHLATVVGRDTVLWDTEGRELARRPGTDPLLGARARWITRTGNDSLLWHGQEATARRLTGVDARFSADGRWLTTTTDDGWIHVWRSEGEPVSRVPGRLGLVSSLGPSVVTAEPSGTVLVTDLRRLGVLSEPAATSLWVDDGSSTARAEASWSRVVTGLGRPLPGWRSDPPDVGDLCDTEADHHCAPDRSMRIVTPSMRIGERQESTLDLRIEQLQQRADGSWQAMPVASPTPLRCQGPSSALEFSPQPTGPWAIVCNDGQLLVVNRDGRVQSTWRLSAPVSSLSWSADGARLAVARSDGLVELRDAVTGAVVHSLAGHESLLVAVQIGPHPDLALTLTRHGIARLWSIGGPTPRLIDTAQNEQDRYVAAKLTSDGRWLIAASASGALYRRAVADAGNLARQFPWLAPPVRP